MKAILVILLITLVSTSAVLQEKQFNSATSEEEDVLKLLPSSIRNKLPYFFVKLAVGAVNEIESIGKAEWKETLGYFKKVFEKRGQTLFYKFFIELKSFTEGLQVNLKDCFVDLIRISIFNALADPKKAVLNFLEDIKDAKGFIKKYWIRFDRNNQKLTVSVIKEAVSKVPSEARKIISDALDNGRIYAVKQCKKLLGSTQQSLCALVSHFYIGKINKYY